MSGASLMFTPDGGSSAQDQEPFRLHETAGLDSVEVHATGKIGGVELNLVVAGVDFIASRVDP